MSTIYITEPPTKGKVLLKTTLGDVDIELWAKEAPKAVRNFVQLCLEGYYDGTIFHRVIKNFIAQGGDPTGTGEGTQSLISQSPHNLCARLITLHATLPTQQHLNTPRNTSLNTQAQARIYSYSMLATPECNNMRMYNTAPHHTRSTHTRSTTHAHHHSIPRTA